MSYKIVNEVLAAAMPDDVSISERLVLLVIAHHADETTRECWPGMELLKQETGMHPDSIRRSLTRLAGRGIPLRMTMSAPGRRSVYKVPELPNGRSLRPGVTAEHPDAASAHSEATPGSSVGNTRILRREHPDAASAPLHQEPSVNPPPASEGIPFNLRNYRSDQVDDALAELEPLLGDRALEALDAFVAWRERIGEPVRNLGAFFRGGIGADLERRIRALITPTPQPSRPEEKCPNCGGDGWDYTRPTGPTTYEKCTHPRRGAVA